MPNPFTHFLRTLRPGAHDRRVEQFVRRWDVVEAIVVDVNRRGAATTEEAVAYDEARRWLLIDYDHRWSPRFAPYWPRTSEGQQPTPSDPFRRILAAPHARDFVGNWPAMQALASARETLNRYLLEG